MMVYQLKRVYSKLPWKTLYRRIRQYCTNPTVAGYREYGAKGITCDFASPEEIKFLWERDKAEGMKSPFLRRRDEKMGYSLPNCFFAETIPFFLDITASKLYKPNIKSN